MISLPIDDKIAQLQQALSNHCCCLLQAEPGAGKTTRVPLALLQQPWLKNQKIILLEPRRIAARSAASYMAKQLKQKTGDSVGYRLRLDSKIGTNTRIEVVTEGILTRMIQDDPSLEGIGCIIFDEFHERSLQADLGLALTLQSQQLFREDLRILIMSATLEQQALLPLLGPDLAVVQCPGRSFEVETHYLGGDLLRFNTEQMTQGLINAIDRHPGSLLAFFPGAGEIRRTHQALLQQSLPEHLEIIPLYGALGPEQQDRAMALPPPGHRKLVLATDIAESSLTIDGVNVVIDCGLTRKPRFDPNSGMSKLITHRISLASAIQRQGRAGRQQAGHCYRLWNRSQEASFDAYGAAEILHADLAPIALELAQWGSDESELSWINSPPAAHLQQARTLLQQLGALDTNNIITAMGRAMVKLGSHPRLAHMMLKAKELGLGALGCDLAAILGEKDLLTNNGQRQADSRLRLEHFYSQRSNRKASGLIRRIQQTSQRWQRQLKVSDQSADSDQAGLLLCFAFPDRIAQRRSASSQHYRLRNGRGATFQQQDSLANNEFLAIADIDGKEANGRIYLAAPIDLKLLQQHFSDQFEDSTEITWDDDSGSVRARQKSYLGKLIVRDQAIKQPAPEHICAGLLEGLRLNGLDSLPWDKNARALQGRIQLVARYQTDQAWPDLSDKALTDTLEQWLVPYIEGFRKLEQLKQLNLYELLLNSLSWQQQQQLQACLPSHFRVPSGSNIAIDYSSREEPQLSVRIQELFGLQQTPTIMQGKLPLTIELLSPARRPIQVTRDLTSFWQNTYAEVCKDLKGRYPRHYWPDDPYQAEATRGTKKQMKRN
ncbi:MAG: ATP-dependent helicase HrpB [Motiliproteus sp.]